MNPPRNEGGGIRALAIITVSLGILFIFLGIASKQWEGVGSGLGAIVTSIFLFAFSRVMQLLGEIADAVEQPVEAEVPRYLYEVEGDVRGPVPLQHLRAMRALPADRRNVSGETLVCLDGKTEWQPLKIVEMEQ